MALRSSGLRRAAERRSDGQHGAQDAARYRRGRGEGRGVAEGRLRPRAGAEGGRRGCCDRRRRGSRSLPASPRSPPSFAFPLFLPLFVFFRATFSCRGTLLRVTGGKGSGAGIFPSLPWVQTALARGACGSLFLLQLPAAGLLPPVHHGGSCPLEIQQFGIAEPSAARAFAQFALLFCSGGAPALHPLYFGLP